MTLAVPEVVPSTLELVEFDLDEAWAIPCEVNKPHGCGGDRAAVWIAYGFNCCPVPKRFFYCEPCRVMLVSVPGGLLCGRCGHHFVPASSAFQRFEPLNP